MDLQPLLGLVGSTALALLSLRFRALTVDGAVTAVVVGTVVVAAGGLARASLLLLFFASGSALSRLPMSNGDGITEKGGRRDAFQVLANGGVAAGAAALHLLSPASQLWTAAYAGALAAATSDTWATEIGMRWGGTPHMLLTGAEAPRGTSGAVTTVGLVAAVLGAVAIGLAAAALFHWGEVLTAAVSGGILGSLADTLVGGTLQRRRWCHTCATGTEQSVHIVCGSRTEPIGGLPWVTNDAVNLAATATGALAAVTLVAL